MYSGVIEHMLSFVFTLVIAVSIKAILGINTSAGLNGIITTFFQQWQFVLQLHCNLLLFSDVQQQRCDIYTLKQLLYNSVHSFQIDCEQLLELISESLQLLK